MLWNRTVEIARAHRIRASRPNDERGAIAIISVMVAMTIFGVAAITIDLSNSMQLRRKTQNAADAASIAGSKGYSDGVDENGGYDANGVFVPLPVGMDVSMADRQASLRMGQGRARAFDEIRRFADANFRASAADWANCRDSEIVADAASANPVYLRPVGEDGEWCIAIDDHNPTAPIVRVRVPGVADLTFGRVISDRNISVDSDNENKTGFEVATSSTTTTTTTTTTEAPTTTTTTEAPVITTTTAAPVITTTTAAPVITTTTAAPVITTTTAAPVVTTTTAAPAITTTTAAPVVTTTTEAPVVTTTTVAEGVTTTTAGGGAATTTAAPTTSTTTTTTAPPTTTTTHATTTTTTTTTTAPPTTTTTTTTTAPPTTTTTHATTTTTTTTTTAPPTTTTTHATTTTTTVAPTTTTTTTIAPACPLMPIAFNGSWVAGNTYDIYSGGSAGNFGWLSWAGAQSDPTLIASLTLPGNSGTYVNPGNSTYGIAANANDHVINVGDWIVGSTGVQNSSGVRARLDALKNIEIKIPRWDLVSGTGANTKYRVQQFLRVKITSYSLPGTNRITATILGTATC